MKLPERFIASLYGIKGFDEREFISVHEAGNAVTSIRINQKKISEKDIYFPLKRDVPWCSSGYYLESRPVFTLDPLLHAGAYYVQEASSMFLEQAIVQLCDLSETITALDLCAAPGGKSTLIQSLIPAESVLVSNEIHKSRSGILEENMMKWGGANVVVTNSSPEQFAKLPQLFNLIVVDAPCSGSGLFRKDPEAIDEWSIQNVQMCARRQKDILEHAIPSLAGGGILIYSTCSYSKEEDEDIAAWCVGQGLTGTRLNIDPAWNIVEVEAAPGVFGYRFYPDKLDGEGFFLAAFKKWGENKTETIKYGSRKKAGVSAAEQKVLENWVATGGMVAELWQNEILLMPRRMKEILPVLQESLYLKSAGLRTGAIVRGELIPNHAIATSGLVKENVKRIEVDLDNALRYLRREEILNASLPAGWYLVTFRNVPLGWIKSLGNRINNYFPKEWRIRMKS